MLPSGSAAEEQPTPMSWKSIDRGAAPDQQRRRFVIRDVACQICEWLAGFCVLVVVVILPWSFAGVDPFSQALMLPALIVAQSLALAAQCLKPQFERWLPTVAAPSVLLIGIGGLQLWPLPVDLVAQLVPRTTALRSELFPSSKTADNSPPAAKDAATSSVTISIYPPATRRKTALAVGAIAVMLISAQVFSRTSTLLPIALVIAVNGAGLAYFGIVQRLTWNGQLYWTIPSPVSTAFGPFVNRNAGGGYLVLCLSAMIPLLYRSFPPISRERLPRVAGERRVFADMLQFLTGDGIGRLSGDRIGVFVLVSSLVAGILMSMSRGAWLGAVMSLGLLLIIHIRTGISRGWLGLVAAGFLAATALLTWLSLTSDVQARAATLSDPMVLHQGRFQLWRDILRVLPDYWRLGSGWGTFGFVQPRYQTFPMTAWSDEAENIYLQVAVEAGVVGLGLIVWLIFSASRAQVTLLRSLGDMHDAMFGGMGLWALFSQCVCAVFDFGLNFPANLFLLALVLGAACGRAARRASSPPSPNRIVVLARAGGLILSGLLLGTLIWGARDLIQAGAVDVVLNRGQSEIDEESMTMDEIEESLKTLDRVLPHRLDDAEGHVRYAGLLIVRYRHQARDQLATEFGDQIDATTLWEATSPFVLHQRAAEFAREHDDERLAALRSDPVIQANLAPARQHAEIARQYGPWLPRSHQFLAQLCFLFDEPLNDGPHIARAESLRPKDPALRYWAGVLHLQSGRFPEACASWQQCLTLSSAFDDKVFQRATAAFSPEKVCRDLLPDSPDVIVRFSRYLQQSSDWSEYRLRLGRRMRAILVAAADKSPQTGEIPYWSGLASRWLGDLSAASDELHEAVRRQPNRVEWRLAWVEVLRDQGEIPQALREAVTCVRMRPADQAARRLMQELLEADRQRLRRESGR